LNFWNNQPHLYIGTSKGSRQFLTKRKISDDYQITRLSRNQLASAAGWVCDLGIVREANSNQRGGPLLDLGTGLPVGGGRRGMKNLTALFAKRNRT
jgi:hypothetical protein